MWLQAEIAQHRREQIIALQERVEHQRHDHAVVFQLRKQAPQECALAGANFASQQHEAGARAQCMCRFHQLAFQRRSSVVGSCIGGRGER
ncbi:hypothetical protein D9M71_720430 [compost metagenome]